MHDNALLADTLLRVARQQNPCAIALTMATIMQLDGHAGLVRVVELLTDEARRDVPPPPPGARYNCHVFAIPDDAPGARAKSNSPRLRGGACP